MLIIHGGAEGGRLAAVRGVMRGRKISWYPCNPRHSILNHVMGVYRARDLYRNHIPCTL